MHQRGMMAAASVPAALGRALVFAALLLLSGGAVRAAPPAFLPGLGDVPAMPGLAAAEPMVFDKPAGRIVETVASGGVERGAIAAFYAAALPQLGWTRVTDAQFQREGEELRLEYPRQTRPGQTTVRFVLTPR